MFARLFLSLIVIIAALDLITKEDLLVFKTELFAELKILLQIQDRQDKEWLKSQEVQKILKISPGTLQNLRINTTLNYTKIGRNIYYRSADIYKLLNEGLNKAK